MKLVDGARHRAELYDRNHATSLGLVDGQAKRPSRVTFFTHRPEVHKILKIF